MVESTISTQEPQLIESPQGVFSCLVLGDTLHRRIDTISWAQGLASRRNVLGNKTRLLIDA